VNPNYPAVSNRAGERCEYCRAREVVFNFAFEVDHIVPRAAGGTDQLDNLALACESCNIFKSDVTRRFDEIERVFADLFNPRIDLWQQHFFFDTESCQIAGLTATGRVTVIQLRLNSAFQLRARRHWMSSDLYP
jgi:hypothetical protein